MPNRDYFQQNLKRFFFKGNGLVIWSDEVGYYTIAQDFERTHLTMKTPEGTLCRYTWNETQQYWKDFIDGHNILEMLARCLVDSRKIHGLPDF